MRVAIVGGRLQGIEAAYLANKAGWEVILLDKYPAVPAAGLSDKFYQVDVTARNLPPIIRTVDLIVPALEDAFALRCLEEKAGKEGIPFAYDPEAYAVSSSKKKSNLLFAELDIPAPKSWPECGLPVIVKPSTSSGSSRVCRIDKMEDFTTFTEKMHSEEENWVVQEFLEGPSYSLEVVGCRDSFVSFQSTEIEVDAQYDCRRVLAPAALSQKINEEFKTIAITIAKALNLNGIMDVEVILHNDTLKILEIDARLPSQTPTAVYKSTGINLLEILYNIFVRGASPSVPDAEHGRKVIYEHIKVSSGILGVSGEHIMADAKPLKVYEDFFGADEAITDFAPGRSQWVATLIITGENKKEVLDKHYKIIKNIKHHFRLSTFIDQIKTSPLRDEKAVLGSL